MKKPANSDRRKVVCSAPGRAGIIGNPTDMYGGAVLSCSVGLRARVTVTSVPSTSFPQLRSGQAGQAPSADSEQAPDLVLETGGQECRIASRDDLRPRGDRFDLARAILDYMHLPPLACHVRYESEIPLRSGLAGSTALVVALLQALLTWQGAWQEEYPNPYRFYRAAEAELFATVEPLAGYVSQLPFVLGFTGVRHASSAVHKPLRERWLEGETVVVEGYRRITEIARMGKKAIIMADWPLLGRLMHENHAIQRDLGGSGESNERLIAAALEAGALGAKLAGAGDGGTIIALWPWPDSTKLEEALREAGASAVYRLEAVPGTMIEKGEIGGCK